jgi:hypothetical protein
MRSSKDDPPERAARDPGSGNAVPGVRASDAERERTTELLRDAAAEGRLSFEELADRIDSAARAVTRGELERLTADLPLPVGAITGHEVVVPTHTSTLFGDVRRSGAWNAPHPRQLEEPVRQRHPRPSRGAGHRGRGDDRRRHHLRRRRVARPRGVVVEVRSRALVGDIRQEAGEVAAAGPPRVILTGGTVFGHVRVRARRLRERITERLFGARHK